MKRSIKPVKALPEVIGWCGVVAILAAYALVSLDLLSTQSIWYPLLNGAGALGLVVDTYFQRDYQPLVLNILWAAIALFGLLRLI